MTAELLHEQVGMEEIEETLQTHPEYQYLNLMKRLIFFGAQQVDKGTGVKTYSLFGGDAGRFVFDLSEGLPLLTTKRVYWKGVVHELYWFLSGQSNIKYLVDNDVHIWDAYPYKIYKEKVTAGMAPEITLEQFIDRIKNNAEFARLHGELPHIYGEMWRRRPANDGRRIDQVKWVLEEMREDPDAHNLVVDSWDPQYMYGMARPEEASRYPICHNEYQINISRGRVNLMLKQRSADIFLGIPFNIGSYAALTYVFAHLTGNKPGTFTHDLGDVHIYENHIPQALEQLKRTPRRFPRLIIDPAATSLDNIRPEHFHLEGYNPDKTIKADLTVAGGYRKKFTP